jgi:hypothetical protein
MNTEAYPMLPERYKSFIPTGDAAVMSSGRSPQHNFNITSKGIKGTDSKEVINSQVIRADYNSQQEELGGSVWL